jgi:hypothetical protein
MIKSKKFYSLLSQITFLSIFLSTSFLNYCLVQIINPYLMPLTIIPVFLYILYKADIPIMLIIPAGLSDDVLLNFPLGTFQLTYSLLAHTLYYNQKRLNNRKWAITIFLTALLLINIFSYFA